MAFLKHVPSGKEWKNPVVDTLLFLEMMATEDVERFRKTSTVKTSDADRQRCKSNMCTPRGCLSRMLVGKFIEHSSPTP